MTFLLIDNSNTRTKFRLADRDGLLEWQDIALTHDLTGDVLTALLEGIEFQQVTLSSVVPGIAAVIEAHFEGRIPVHRISCHSALSIGIDYPEPEQIGADRLANAVAAHARFGAPAVVIDFGTAVTFDVVDCPGAYLGGAIAPGLASMTENLSKRTALLPQIHLEEPTSAIGKSTVQAMQIGAVLGYRGMIREILQGIRHDLSGDPTVVATGGDAALISAGLPEIKLVDPELTIEGIWRIALANTSPPTG
jgi:type III pantothenate kinase